MKLTNVTISGEGFAGTIEEAITPAGTKTKLKHTSFTTNGLVLLGKITQGALKTGSAVNINIAGTEHKDTVVRVEEWNVAKPGAVAGMEVGLCLQTSKLNQFLPAQAPAEVATQ